MEIVFVSTFNVPCGIATYTQHLGEALVALGHNVTVLSENDPRLGPATPGQVGKIKYYPIWSRGHAYNSRLGLNTVYNAIISSSKKPDVVHFQHEFGLFPDSRDLSRLIETLPIPTITTFHTVPYNLDRRADFFQFIGTNAIVHTTEGASRLGYAGLIPQVIPHGTPQISLLDGFKVSRTRLGLDLDATILLVPGFIARSKNHDEIIDAFAKAFDGRTRQLLIWGLNRDEAYLTKLIHKIKNYGLENVINIKSSFLTEDLYAEALNAADLVILGSTDETPFSASGQLNTAIGYRKIVLAKNSPIYRGNARVTYYADTNELSDLIRNLLAPRTRYALERSLWNLPAPRYWPEVAEMHLEEYRRIIKYGLTHRDRTGADTRSP